MTPIMHSLAKYSAKIIDEVFSHEKYKMDHSATASRKKKNVRVVLVLGFLIIIIGISTMLVTALKRQDMEK